MFLKGLSMQTCVTFKEDVLIAFVFDAYLEFLSNKGISPNSCGSSWHKTASDVASPERHDTENAAPMARPSAKLWIPSPMVIINGSRRFSERREKYTLLFKIITDIIQSPADETKIIDKIKTIIRPRVKISYMYILIIIVYFIILIYNLNKY